MIDCLAATGAEPLLPLGAGIVIALIGSTVLVVRRRRVRDRDGSGRRAARGAATLGIMLLR